MTELILMVFTLPVLLLIIMQDCKVTANRIVRKMRRENPDGIPNIKKQRIVYYISFAVLMFDLDYYAYAFIENAVLRIILIAILSCNILPRMGTASPIWDKEYAKSKDSVINTRAMRFFVEMISLMLVGVLGIITWAYI